MSDLDSRHPRKPLKDTTSTRSAPSQARSPSEEESSRLWLSPPRCKEPSSWEEIICIMLTSTTDTKRSTPTSQSTSPPPSQSRKETSLSLAKPDPSLRLWDSTSSRSSPTRSLETSESNLFCSDMIDYLRIEKYLRKNIIILFQVISERYVSSCKSKMSLNNN